MTNNISISATDGDSNGIPDDVDALARVAYAEAGDVFCACRCRKACFWVSCCRSNCDDRKINPAGLARQTVGCGTQSRWNLQKTRQRQ